MCVCVGWVCLCGVGVVMWGGCGDVGGDSTHSRIITIPAIPIIDFFPLLEG